MALMIPPKNLRLHYDAERGWLLDVPWLLPTSVVRRVVELAVPKQIDRWRSLPAGEKRDDLKNAIEKLQFFAVQQNVVGTRGDGTGDLVLFDGRKG